MHCYFKRRVVISTDAMSDCIVLFDALILKSCLVGYYVHHRDGFRGLLDVTMTFFLKKKCQTGLTVSSLKITCMSLFIYVAVLRQSWLLLLCFLEQSCSISLHAHQSLPAWPLQARDSVTGAASADFLGKIQCTHRWCLLLVQYQGKDDVETILSKHYSRGLIWYVLDLNRFQKMGIWNWLRAVLFCMKSVSKGAVVSLF